MLLDDDRHAAWKAIREHRPRAAILDAMPGVTGDELAATVRAAAGLADARVLQTLTHALPRTRLAASLDGHGRGAEGGKMDSCAGQRHKRRPGGSRGQSAKGKDVTIA